MYMNICITYADDSQALQHTLTQAHIYKTYLHNIHTWTESNKLILNLNKTTCTLFTHDTAERNIRHNTCHICTHQTRK